MTRNTLTTEARKPLYAVVGVGDLAVAKTRELPTELAAKAATIVPRTTTLVTELPTKLQTVSVSLYGDLVTRGEKLVTSIRRQKATQEAVAQVKTAKARTKAAATSATKAVKATAGAVDGAAEKIG
jgi:heparin binding hemagglutinin HbhA